MDGRQWEGIAPRIAAAFDSTSTVVKLHSGPEVHILQCTENMIVPDKSREWAEHWHQRDLWVERTVAVGLSKIVTDQGLVTREEQRSSGFYQEWLRALDIFHVVGAAFPAGEDSVGILGIHRPRDGRYYSKTEVARVALFLPHLQRALQLTGHFAAVRHLAALDALEKLDTGVLVADRRGRILHSNSLAAEILRGGGAVRAAGGRLSLRDPGLQEKLARQLRRAVDTASGALASRTRSWPCPAATGCRSRCRSRPCGRAAPSRPRARWPWSSCEIRNFRPRPARGCAILFGLTPTEAAVARDLAAGRSLEEIARRRGVGMATVRSHLKQILVKTGTNRQAETVALFARSWRCWARGTAKPPPERARGDNIAP